ncbi:MAG: hypothetical protein ACJAWL_002253 [Motiliproteus sp.]|jgi:hypothetical protein
MKLITRSTFEALRLNDLNEYDADASGHTQLVRLYKDGKLIAKKKTRKNRCAISLSPAMRDTCRTPTDAVRASVHATIAVL